MAGTAEHRAGMLPNLPRQFARRDEDQRLDMMLCRFETLKHRQNKAPVLPLPVRA